MPRQATGGKIGAPKKTRLSAKQSEGLAIEVQRAKQVSTDGITGSNLARKIGVTRAAVSKWRKDPLYQAFFSKLLGQRWSQIVEQKWLDPIGQYYIDPDFKVTEVDSKSAALQAKTKRRKEAFEYLTKDSETYSLSIHEYVKKNWLGPFDDVHSGEHFHTSDQHFGFLVNNYLFPNGLLDEVVEMLGRARAK